MRSGAPVPAQISFFLYNTTCSIFLFDRRPDADALLSGAKEIAHAVRRMLDFYDPDSELGRLNRSYIPGQPYAVSEELASFLQTILSFSVQSGGCYDPTLGPVSKLWNFPSGEPQVPEADALRAALSRCGPRLIRCSERTVTLDRPGMLLDAGGAGKGYAADRTAEFLQRRGVRCAAINFGGNLRLIGARTGADGETLPWRIGVQRPWGAYGQSLGTLSLPGNCGIATSGGYDRFFRIGETVYHHLIDPRTGRPSDSPLASTTIVSPSAFYADLLSTACFVAGPEQAAALCAAQPETGAVLTFPDGRTLVSPALRANFEEHRTEAAEP